MKRNWLRFPQPAGLLLRTLLNILLPSVCGILPALVNTTVGRRSCTPTSPMTLKSVFFLLAAGLLLLLLPVLLELSSLTKLWSVDSLSGATICYIAECYPVPVVDVNWSASGKLHVDLHKDLFCCFWLVGIWSCDV